MLRPGVGAALPRRTDPRLPGPRRSMAIPRVCRRACLSRSAATRSCATTRPAWPPICAPAGSRWRYGRAHAPCLAPVSRANPAEAQRAIRQHRRVPRTEPFSRPATTPAAARTIGPITCTTRGIWRMAAVNARAPPAGCWRHGRGLDKVPPALPSQHHKVSPHDEEVVDRACRGAPRRLWDPPRRCTKRRTHQHEKAARNKRRGRSQIIEDLLCHDDTAGHRPIPVSAIHSTKDEPGQPSLRRDSRWTAAGPDTEAGEEQR